MNTITTGTVDYDWDVNEKGYIYLSEKVVKAGTYTLLIPTGAFTFDENGKSVNAAAVYTYTVDGTEDGGEETPTGYIKQMALTATGGSINFTEDIMFTGNAESVTCDIMSGETKVATATLSYDAADYTMAVVTFDTTLENGTYTIVFDGKISSWTTAQVLPIEPTEFTIGETGGGEGMKVIDFALNAKGGTLNFNDDVSFADWAYEITVDVVNAETDATVTTAKLSYNEVDYKQLIVSFTDELVNGTYKLKILDNQIISFTTGAAMAAQEVLFEIGATGINTMASNEKVVRYTLSGQKAGANAKGILIIGGKRVLVK